VVAAATARAAAAVAAASAARVASAAALAVFAASVAAAWVAGEPATAEVPAAAGAPEAAEGWAVLVELVPAGAGVALDAPGVAGGEGLPASGKVSPLPLACCVLLEALLRAGLAETLFNVSEKPCWEAGAVVCPAPVLN
jgi:hypothetical protein